MKTIEKAIFLLILFGAISYILIFFSLPKEVQYVYAPPGGVIVTRDLPENYFKEIPFNVSLNIQFFGDSPDKSVLLLGEVFPGGKFGGKIFNSFGKISDADVLALMESPVVNKTIIYTVNSSLETQTFSGKWKLDVYDLEGKVKSTYEGVIIGDSKTRYASQIPPLCNNNGICGSGEDKNNCPSDCECDNSWDCNDGLFCTTDYCLNGKCSTSNSQCYFDTVDCTQEICDENRDACISIPNNSLCSSFSLNLISTCGNNPDSNPFTWDLSQAVNSVCDVDNGCFTPSRVYNHECRDSDLGDTKKGIACSASCDENSDCPNTICSEGYCSGNDYHYYGQVKNNCLGSCICENNACGPVLISYNDARCKGCNSNSDCMNLNKIVCNNGAVLNESWFCNSTFRCEKNNFLLSNCSNFSRNSISRCNGVKFEYFSGFSSECSNNICSQNNSLSSLVCSKSCGASCESNSDCGSETCNLDSCTCSISNQNPSGGGGGGGGGGGRCVSNWNCSWSLCINGTESKICSDLKRCNSAFLKYSNESRKCELNNQTLNTLNNELPLPGGDDNASQDYSRYYSVLKNIGIVIGLLVFFIGITIIFILIKNQIIFSKFHLNKVKAAKDFVKSLRERGFLDAVIRQMFLEKGWKDEDIKKILDGG